MLNAYNGRQPPPEYNTDVIEQYCSLLHDLIGVLRALGHQWQTYSDHIQSQQFGNRYQSPVVAARGPGRPRFEISQDQLVYLHSLSFSWTQIAAMLGVSRMTVYRRRSELGMLNPATRAVSDGNLQSLVRELHSLQPALVRLWFGEGYGPWVTTLLVKDYAGQ